MPWAFDVIEAFNIFVGGVLTSFLFIVLTKLYECIIFSNRYKRLKSYGEVKDWESRPMSEENTREINWNKVQGRANIKIRRRKFEIVLEHGERKWKGEISMLTPNYGILIFRYIDEFEFGTRECFIGEISDEKGCIFDFIHLVPKTNKIYGQTQHGKLLYDYGDEVLVRNSTHKSLQ